MTEEERKEKKRKDLKSRRRSLIKESEEDKSMRKKKDREAKKFKRDNEPKAEKEKRLENARQKYSSASKKFIQLGTTASRILTASSHQGSSSFDGIVGSQCTAMSLGFLLKSVLKSPSNWSRLDLDTAMHRAHVIYQDICTTLGPAVPPSGHLLANNLTSNGNELEFLGQTFSITVAEDPEVFGSLTDGFNDGYGATLLDGLIDLFKKHAQGILISRGYSYGLIQMNEKFFLTDSHSCDDMGNPHALNGQACAIEADNILDLLTHIRKRVGYGSDQYTIDKIRIEIK